MELGLLVGGWGAVGMAGDDLFLDVATPEEASPAWVEGMHRRKCAAKAPRRPVEPPAAPPQREQARPLGDGALSVVCVPGQLINPGVPAGYALPRPRHVGELAAAVSEQVRTIFVTRDAAAWLELPDHPVPGAPHPFVDDAIAAGVEVHGDGLSWFLRVAARGRYVAVVLLPYDVEGRAAPWSSSTSTAAEVIDGLAAFRRAVGTAFGPTIGQTGERLLLATHPKDKSNVRLDPSPVMPPALGGVHEIGSSWRAAVDVDAFAAATHVHWYDANANYLGAYQVAELGRGEPVHHRVNVDRLLGKYLPAGLWRAKLPDVAAGMSEGRPGDIPAPWSTDHEWHTSPTITRARELGVDVEALVTEAWVWPLSSRFCQPFGALMRDARSYLLADVDAPGHRAALAAVAMVYQRLHGRLGAAFRGAGDAWHRPDWMHTLRAQARVNLDRRLRTLAVAPFAVYVDAAYFLSTVDDAAAFAGGLSTTSKPLLGDRAELGRFRVAGSVALTDQLRAELAGAHTAAAVDRLLKSHLHGTTPPAAAFLPAEVTQADVDDDGLDELAAALREDTSR